jgi:hypothetical protein
MPNETNTEDKKPPAAVTKPNPYQPKQPAIPGVPAKSAQKKTATPTVSRPAVPGANSPRGATSAPPVAGPEPKKALAIIAGLVACGLLAGLILYMRSQQPAANAQATDGGSAPSAVAELQASAAPTGNLPVGPGVIAKADELAKPWSSKKFVFSDPVLGSQVPALVVRLPRGGYWGFSTKEPYGTCDLEFVTDLQRLQDVYGFRADHPMVGDPCNKSVFDLMQWGGPTNAEVRGMPVHGMGVRPPIAIEIEQKGDEVSAVRMEQ